MPSERYEYYLDQCKIHHATKKTFSGRGVLKHFDRLIGLSAKVGAESALDYGCGKGNQYFEKRAGDKTLEETLGYRVRKYDPAVPQFKKLPIGQFDLVWCTDVLEHIPEEDIGWVIRAIDAYAKKALFITVGTYPAKKRLPNGENAHITVRPGDWWREQFEANLSDRSEGPGFMFDMLVE